MIPPGAPVFPDTLERSPGPAAASKPRSGGAGPDPGATALAAAWALLAFAGPALGALLAGRVVPALGVAGARGLGDAAAAGLFAGLAVLGPAAPTLPRLTVAGGRHGSASLLGAAGLAALLGALAAGAVSFAREGASPLAGAAASAIGGSIAAAATLAPAAAALGARGRAAALLATGTALGIGVSAAAWGAGARLSPALAAAVARSGVAAGAAIAATGLAAIAIRRLPPCGDLERDEAFFSLRRHAAAGLASGVLGAVLAASLALPAPIEGRALAILLALPAPIYALVSVRRRLPAGAGRSAAPASAPRAPPGLASLLAVQALCGAAAVGLAGPVDRRLAALVGAAAGAIVLLLPAIVDRLGLGGDGPRAPARGASGQADEEAGEEGLARRPET